MSQKLAQYFAFVIDIAQHCCLANASSEFGLKKRVRFFLEQYIFFLEQNNNNTKCFHIFRFCSTPFFSRSQNKDIIVYLFLRLTSFFTDIFQANCVVTVDWPGMVIFLRQRERVLFGVSVLLWIPAAMWKRAYFMHSK